MKIYNSWYEVPENMRSKAVSKDLGTCEDTGRQLVYYIVDEAETSPESKRCSGCDKNKDIEEFKFRDGAHTERKNVCASCHNAVVAEYQARKRCKKKCPCCTIEQIRDFYRMRDNKSKVVDHILPIAYGGLHCLKNLQLISTEKHKTKTNKDRRLKDRLNNGRQYIGYCEI